MTIWSKTRAEADAWATVFRALGLDVGSPAHLTHRGEWMVRALPAGQRGESGSTPPSPAIEPTG